jgi:hypothetical protein
MKRTLNETGRLRILAADFTAVATKRESNPGYDVRLTWDFSHLALSEHASLSAVFSGRSVYKRIELGHLGAAKGEYKFAFTDLEEHPTVRCELFVTEMRRGLPYIAASSTSFLLVMGAIPGYENTLLPIKLVSTLQSLWRVDYSAGKPILEVSGTTPSAPYLHWFKSAVIPEVIREIFTNVMLDTHELDEDALTSWGEYFEQFTSFGKQDVSAFGSVDDVHDYIQEVWEEGNRVVAKFTGKFDLLKPIKEESNS